LYDDLIPDESPLVQEALRRLTPQQRAERTYRFRRALAINVKKTVLPEAEWIKPEQDVPYLEPVLKQIEAELDTRHNYLNLTAVPAALLARNRSS
jgi:ubiquinol-cytochrome c reductase subunit 7